MKKEFRLAAIQHYLAKRKFRALIHSLPETDGVNMIGKNCCTVSSSLIFQHNNWSPSYWISKETKQQLLNILKKSKDVSGAVETILATKRFKDGHHIAPNVLDALRRAWES